MGYGLVSQPAAVQSPAGPQQQQRLQQQQQRLRSPLTPEGEGACHVSHPSGQHHAGEEEEAEVLFSPTFHALHGHLSCAPSEGGGRDEPSTDGSDSTGTSATLDAGEDSLGGGSSSSEARASTGSARGPASSLPLAVHTANGSTAAVAEEDEDDSYLDFDPFLFIKRLPPVDQCVPPRREFLLPRQTRRTKRKTLVLDLDETLVGGDRWEGRRSVGEGGAPANVVSWH